MMSGTREPGIRRGIKPEFALRLSSRLLEIPPLQLIISVRMEHFVELVRNQVRRAVIHQGGQVGSSQDADETPGESGTGGIGQPLHESAQEGAGVVVIILQCR